MDRLSSLSLSIVSLYPTGAGTGAGYILYIVELTGVMGCGQLMDSLVIGRDQFNLLAIDISLVVERLMVII